MKIEPSTSINKKVNKPKKPLISYRKLEDIKDFSFALPALILLIVFTYYPLIYSGYISMTDWNFIRPDRNFVGFDNYTWLFNRDMFYHSLKVTGIYTVLDVTITLSLGLAFAVLLDKTTKTYSFFRLVIFMPHYIAMVIAGIIFIWILNTNYGILNQTLQMFGIGRVQWLQTSWGAMFSVVMVSVWKSVGYAMIIFLAGLRGIPKEYYEASYIDGASKWNSFRFITLPLLSPITLFLLVTSVISSMKVFQSIDIMTGGGPLNATKVIVYWIYDLAFQDFRVGRASALVVVFFIMIVLVVIIQMQVAKKKVHYER